MDSISVDRNATEITIPSSVKTLEPYCFDGCSKLQKVHMPFELNVFPEGMFQNCSSLQEIPFRAGITEILKNTFKGCAALKSIIFPESINAIRAKACADCTNLKTVVLPAKMWALADDAFENCNNITNIRIDESNKLFYISEKDGCLYERNVDGPDILKIRIAGVNNAGVSFYKDNVDEETENFFTDEQIFEDDDTFYSEIGDSDMENENSVDDMLQDIMGQEKEREDAIPENVGISVEELDALSMSEPVEETSDVSLEDYVNELDGKNKILADSVANYKVEIVDSVETPREDFDLYVIAERSNFSEKLVACAKKIAWIQEFKRIIFLTGLPLDNDEFTQFYHHFISQKNVVLACTAEGPSSLSDYCKAVCEQSRISLDKKDLVEQHRKMGIKNNDLIKIIIRDVE